MQTIYLDLSNTGLYSTIYAKQGDVGRKFKAILTDNMVAYAVPVGAAFSVWYSGASGAGNYTDIGAESAVAVSGNEVTVELIAQMLNNAGEGELCLIMTGADGSQLGTWNIPYRVEAVPGLGSEEAKQYLNALEEAVKRAEEAAQRAEGVGLPPVTEADNGKIAQVVSGAWAAAEVPNLDEVSY